MKTRILPVISILILSFFIKVFALEIPNKQDIRSKNLRYKYDRLKEQEKYKKEGKILNLTPSGYMTVEEYEELSKYQDKSKKELDMPKVQTPSDFKYVPHPTYKIVKYNSPAGSTELRLGKRLYSQRQINAQGIVAPDFSMLVYPAIYYYTDSASVAADVFVIPLFGQDQPLEKILKANIMHRIPEPILSTDKSISDYAAFRSLTPVDFSADGKKILIKEKIGSREDGIWQTSIFVYDFANKTDYKLDEVRDAIVYFWKEYMNLNLNDYRWDIFPLGFLKSQPDRVAVQAIAYTGETPVFLGTWSIDTKGNQSRVVTFQKNVEPLISANGYKVVQDGVEEYDVIEREEKNQEKESKILKKQNEQYKKDRLKQIDYEYKYAVKHLEKDYRMEYRDYRKLRSISGMKDSEKLKEAYRKFLIEQYTKDIEKSQKHLEKQNKQLDKINQKLDKLYDAINDDSKYTPVTDSTLDDYINKEKVEKEGILDGFDLEDYEFDYENKFEEVPKEILDYSENSETPKLRPAESTTESGNSNEDEVLNIKIFD